MPMPPLAHNTTALRMLARLLLRIGWSTGLLLALVTFIRDWPWYARQNQLAAAGASVIPDLWRAFAWTIACAVPALWMLTLDLFLLKWLVPPPRPGCPGCGYDLSALKSDRCPECGLLVKAPEPRQ